MMYTPIEMKRNMQYGSNYWTGKSFKIGREVHFYSELEYDNWILIETDPDVVEFCEQPLEIEYLYEGKTRKSIFDMWVKRRDDSEEFIEVKYGNDLTARSSKYEQTKRQITVQREWCAENNYRHILNTEEKIRGNKMLLDNKRTMLPYFEEFKNCNENECEMVLNSLKYRKKAVGELKEELEDLSKQKLYLTLFYLIYQGKISANLDKVPISYKLEVWLNE